MTRTNDPTNSELPAAADTIEPAPIAAHPFPPHEAAKGGA